ncbi:MAG: hypothetical protein K2K24_04995, partial [Clostridia bacterium]|nr:hypothetical protein [Clostridia bacterium]
TFTITKGELYYGSQTRVEVGWSQSAYFHLYVSDRADDFDTVKAYRNGQVQDIAFTKDENSPNAYVTVTDSTGKNGMKYAFIAYAKDGDKDIVVAETKSSEDKLVKIDNEKPEISDISYFVRDDDGNDTPIAPNDRFVWRKDRIVARYNVVDTKSGLNFVPTLPEGKTQGILIDNGDMKEDGSYDVEVVLSRNTVYVINYTDAMGNVLPVELQANVDHMTTDPALEHSRITYPTADYGYSTKGARIRFNPTVGCSEWRLQYSWEKNPDGTDKWEYAMAQDANGANTDEPYIINGNKEQSFLINWNMGDPVRKVGAPFKMRIVNMAKDADGNALYDPVEYSKDSIVTDNGFVGRFCINYKIASIYVDNSLKAVKVSGGLYDGRTLEDLLANLSTDELKELLDKDYDGTSVYNNSIYAESFYVDVEFMTENRENPQEFVDATGIGVLYSLAYVDIVSDATEIQTRINVKLRYQSADAGTVNIIVEFADEQEDESVLEDYDWYFAQFKDAEGENNIDFTNEDEMVADKFISSQRLIRNREIRRLEFEIYLSDSRVVRGLQNAYYYGEVVPQIVKAYVFAGDPVDIRLTCDAQNRVDVGLYECTGEAINYDTKNLKLTVRETIIDIEAKPVYVETMFDGSRDIPSTVNAGTTHEFTASYKDVDGKSQKATVTSSMGDEEVVDGKIYKKGNYEIIVSLTDKNYAISDANRDDGTLLLNFKIVQGRLALAMGINVVEYNGGNGIKYNAGIPVNINSNLFTDNLEYTYYTYNASARYDATSKQITGGTWDRTSGTSKEPSAVGLYHVEVYYKGNDAFFAETYSGDLNIVKASTEIKFGKQVSYAYKVDENDIAIARTFDVKTAQMTVSEKNGGQKLLWHYSDSDRDESLITIYYRNQNGEYVEISDNALGGGWYTETGNYAYRVKFAGDESHEECIVNATLHITPAVFEGLIFESVSGTYDGKDFMTKLNPVVPYPEAEVVFTYANKNYTSIKDIHITEAGSYRIRMTVRQSGFETVSLTANVVIAKAKIEANKLTSVPVSAVYDGQRHAVTFNGFDIVGGKYYYKGFEANITSSNSEGNIWAVNAGNYNGKVTVKIDNFEDYVIETYIQIDRAEIKVDSARTDLEEKLPSGLSVNGIYGAYTINGEETPCYLIY